MGLIISAITFKIDTKGNNVYIFWIGIRQYIPDNYQDDFSIHFIGLYRSLGLSSFLMVLVTTLMVALDMTDITLYLQYSIDTTNLMMYYHKRGFTTKKNLKSETPYSLYISDNLFITEKHMVLA